MKSYCPSSLLLLALLLGIGLCLCPGQVVEVYVEQDSELPKTVNKALQQSRSDAGAAVATYQHIIKNYPGVVIATSGDVAIDLFQLEQIVKAYQQRQLDFQKKNQRLPPDLYIPEIFANYPPLLLSENQLRQLVQCYSKGGITALNQFAAFPGLYNGAGEYVRMQMGQIDAARDRYPILTLQTQSLVRQALLAASPLKLYQVASNYPLWSCGKKPLVMLGDFYLARGAMDQAIGLWRRLQLWQPRFENDTGIQVRIALASLLRGDRRICADIIQRYSRNQAMVEINQKKFRLHRVLTQAQKMVATKTPRYWLNYGGDSSAGLLARSVDLRKNNFKMIHDERLHRSKDNVIAPLYWDNCLYYNLPLKLLAIEMGSWRRRWQYKPGRLASNPGLRQPSVYRRHRNNRRQSTIDTATIATGRVYSFGRPHSDHNALYAIDAAQGKKIWQWPTHIDQSISFHSMPVVVNDKVFALATVLTGQTNVELFCFAATEDTNAQAAPAGKLLWHRFLGSIIIPSYRNNDKHYLPETSGICAAYGLVYCCTNIGVVAAVDAVNGEIRWLAKYHQHYRPKYRLRSSAKSGERYGTPPIARHGKLYVMPLDSHQLFVYDAFSGALERTFPEGQMTSEFCQLLGVGYNQQIFLTSTNKIVALGNDDTDEILWQIILPEKIQGQGLVSKDWLYVLTSNSLYQINAQTGVFYRVMKSYHNKYARLRKKSLPAAACSLLIIETNRHKYLIVSGDRLHIYQLPD